MGFENATNFDQVEPRAPYEADRHNQKIIEMKSRILIDNENDDGDTDSFESCDENPNGQFPRPPSIITMQKTMQHATPVKRTKTTKNFTISVFVDSIENYSYGDSSSTSTSPLSDSNNKTITPPFSCDHESGCKVDCAFNYRCDVVEKKINEYAYVMNELVQLGSLTASSNQDDNHDYENVSPELIINEFEFRHQNIDGKPCAYSTGNEMHTECSNGTRTGKFKTEKTLLI